MPAGVPFEKEGVRAGQILEQCRKRMLLLSGSHGRRSRVCLRDCDKAKSNCQRNRKDGQILGQYLIAVELENAESQRSALSHTPRGSTPRHLANLAIGAVGMLSECL